MGSGQYNYSEELQFQMQIGSKMIPEYPIRSLAEAFYHLRKTLGINSTNAQMNHGTAILQGSQIRSCFTM